MTETKSALLTAADRCDRCGAQAYVKVEMAFGELLFCGHHYNQNSAALASTAVSVHDETHLIK
ncbi:MAG: hypothetical protein RL038_996 [Actinomycetota bacterium]|jgi:hypothetical protein